MQQQMQQNQAAQQGNPYQNRQKAEETPKRAASEDYIDYEEIK